MTLSETLETLTSYEEMCNKKMLHIITTKHDICDGRGSATIMKYYKVKPVTEMMSKDYEIHDSRVLKKTHYTVQPRKFYTVTEVRRFVDDLKSKAGRTLEDDEIAVMLRTITKGEPYTMTFLVDITEELKEQLKWRDIK